MTIGATPPPSPAAGAAAEGLGASVDESLRSLVQLLPRVVRGMRCHPQETLELGGVTLGPRHGSALVVIRERATTVSQLAAELQLNLATVSGVVAELERVGFVQRSSDPADRRRTIVAIAPGNEPLVNSWLEGATAPLQRALQRLSAGERRALIRAMGYLEAELNSTAQRG